MSAWLDRAAKRKDKNPEEQAKGQKALLQHRALFEEEKIRLEKLKAQLAAEPAGGRRHGHGFGVDDDGTSLSAANAKNLETSRPHHNSAEQTEVQIRTRGESG